MNQEILHSGVENQPPSPSLPLLRYVPILALLALVLVLVSIGATQAFGTIAESLRYGRLVAVGQPIATSYGTLTVTQVEKLVGLKSSELAGMTHGVQNLVHSNEVQIQLFLQFSNRSNRAIAYSPANFRLLIADSSDPAENLAENLAAITQAGLDPASGTLKTGLLPAQATLQAEVDFVTPRTNRPLWVLYQDPESSQLTRIEIGPADVDADAFPPEPEDEHPHADATLPAPPNLFPPTEESPDENKLSINPIDAPPPESLPATANRQKPQTP